MVLQLVHGRVEYVDRYDAFAFAMCQKGIAVVGHDHLGHGKTASDDGKLGYFAPDRASDVLVADIYEVTKYIRKEFPGIKNCIMGHSMGSFLTRKYLTQYSEKVDKAIIMGTGYMPLAMVLTARAIAGVIGAFRGQYHKSTVLTSLAFGSYNKHFAGEKSEYAWLTKDEQLLKIHDGDKYATFTFTVNGYKGLFDTLIYLARWKNFDNVRRELPVLFVAGEDDPVGNYGKGTEKVYREFKKRGMADVSIKIYDNDRHELVNETDRDVVYEDISAWLLGERK
jgi:alpha-beta hydrolase superfamily lysophospholipase